MQITFTFIEVFRRLLHFLSGNTLIMNWHHLSYFKKVGCAAKAPKDK